MIIIVTQLVSLLKVYFPTLDREEGQGMVEYALIIALVAVLLVGGLVALRGGIGDTFTDIFNALSGVDGGGG
jgi:pilus assembly protein Flp/PilA